MIVALALLLAVGCQGKRAPELEPLVLEAERVAVVERMRVEGPVRWLSDDRTVCVEVPEGWIGWVGDGEALLALDHGSGVSVSVLRGASPIERPGFVRAFEDDGSYRDVPALFPAATVTWTSEQPGGPTIQEWIGAVDRQQLRLEARYPWGRAVYGRQVAEELLTALCAP